MDIARDSLFARNYVFIQWILLEIVYLPGTMYLYNGYCYTNDTVDKMIISPLIGGPHFISF